MENREGKGKTGRKWEMTKERIWEGKNMDGKEGEGRRERSKYKRKLWKLNVMSRSRIL